MTKNRYGTVAEKVMNFKEKTIIIIIIIKEKEKNLTIKSASAVPIMQK